MFKYLSVFKTFTETIYFGVKFIDSKIIKTLVDEGLYIDRDIYRNFIE